MSAVALLALVGCSSAVSNGMARQEWTVLGPASTREDAERFLGKPVFFESFVHPKTIDEVAAELAPRLDVPNVPLFTPRYIVDAGTGKFEAVALPVSIVSHAKYRIVGSFLPRGAPGGPEEAVKCAIGISDVSAIPISVSYAPSTTSKPVIVGNGLERRQSTVAGLHYCIDQQIFADSADLC